MSPLTPPLAPTRPHAITQHGQTRNDPYFWLRDRADPAVLDYLQAENAYTEALMAPTAALQERLVAEMRARIREEDESVPERYGDHLYYTRTEQGQQYAAIYRRPAANPEAAPQCLLDLNALAVGRTFCKLGGWRVSDDGRWLAYLIDFAGDEAFTLVIVDLETGVALPELIENAYYGLAWGADNATLFYTVIDAAHRPYRIFRHRRGTDPAQDVLIHDEADPMFFVTVRRTRSEAFLVITCFSGTTGEAYVIAADRPDEAPRLVVPRRHGVEITLEHQGDRFLLVTNDAAQNFRLLSAPVASIDDPRWVELIAHREDVMLESVEGFAGGYVVLQRRRGLRELVIHAADGSTRAVAFPDAAYNTTIDESPEYASGMFRIIYSSPARPETVADIDLATGAWTIRKTDQLPCGHNPADYVVERIEAPAADGARVPISLIYRRGALGLGGLPTLLIGYGAYGSNIEPGFYKNWLSLVDRGMICAIAHIRGGSDLGRAWYEHGKLRFKRNTFSDFIACGEHLIRSGYTRADSLAALGVSAGGLLMGAVFTQRPDLWRTVVAKVPFVDVVSTMSDPTIPLTAIEWEQWGNPIESADDCAYMLSYSPYENLRATAYPNLLLTAGLNDPRVQYWEPAKFCARLRTLKTDTNRLLLKTNLAAGHAGASGRFDYLREIAHEWAFILDTLGLADAPVAGRAGA